MKKLQIFILKYHYNKNLLYLLPPLDYVDYYKKAKPLTWIKHSTGFEIFKPKRLDHVYIILYQSSHVRNY
jgi:hypothetical protein